ncbi:MAG: hypothetical protein AAGF12_39030 [Myxococcota bacterium]
MNVLGRWAAPSASLLAVFGLACGSGSGSLEPRFVAVHNALSATGLAQTGAISEGSLPEGADATIPMRLRAGTCYTFVALGSTSVDNIDVRVTDGGGEEIARDTTMDRQAAAQACPERDAEYLVIITMGEGQGSYTVSSWSGQVGAGGRSSAVAGGLEGSCSNPLALEAGAAVSGSTVGGSASMTGRCLEGEAPERVYTLEVAQRAQLSAVLRSGYDGALYLQRQCGQPGTEVACNDDNPDTSRSQIDTTLEPGTYYLVVDGYGTEAGEYDLIASLTPLAPVAEICRDATELTLGQAATGSTAGRANYFQATCAEGARSPDQVYRMEVSSRSRVRIRQQSDHDGALYIRSTCDDPTSEVVCNDDYRDPQHSSVTTILAPGRYYVFSDGFQSGSAGNYSITAEATADSGGGTAGDVCGSPETATPNQELVADTFDARDDLAGSCGGRGGGDVVYALDLRNRSRVRAVAQASEFAGVMYLQSTCGDQNTEVQCIGVNAGTAPRGPAAPPGGVPGIDQVLNPGRYFLVLDGQRPDAFGELRLDLQVDDLVALERSCRSAPLIRPGQVINGTTVGGSDRFQATCAGGASSNDIVYRLRLARRQIVRASLSSDYDSSIHLRRDCTDASTELACNDDHNDNRHAFIETTLDRGTYFLVVDGYASGNEGTFTLDVQTSNP